MGNPVARPIAFPEVVKSAIDSQSTTTMEYLRGTRNLNPWRIQLPSEVLSGNVSGQVYGQNDAMSLEHPLRRVLVRQRQVRETIPAATELTTDQSQELLNRQPQPRNFSLVIGMNYRATSLETAMQRLRRQLRTSAELAMERGLVHRSSPGVEPELETVTDELYSDDLPLESAEPRDRLEYARRRIMEAARTEADINGEQISTYADIVSQSSNAALQSTQQPQITTAREMLTETTQRLLRTRNLLAARQQQHVVLTARLEESTRAIGRQLDSMRNSIIANDATPAGAQGFRQGTISPSGMTTNLFAQPRALLPVISASTNPLVVAIQERRQHEASQQQTNNEILAEQVGREVRSIVERARGSIRRRRGMPQPGAQPNIGSDALFSLARYRREDGAGM